MEDVYWENDWHIMEGLKYNNDMLLAKYWASKEMAKDVFHDNPESYSYLATAPLKYSINRYINYLSQLLKKEWFRS